MCSPLCCVVDYLDSILFIFILFVFVCAEAVGSLYSSVFSIAIGNFIALLIVMYSCP